MFYPKKLINILITTICVFSLSSVIFATKNQGKLLFDYLYSIKNVSMDFTQETKNQGVYSGVLLISKPYDFRCNYFEPFPLLIIGNKDKVSVYDYEIDQLTSSKFYRGIFEILLRKDKIEKYIKITGIVDSNKDITYYVKIKNIKEESQITLRKNPLGIDSIKIIQNGNDFKVKFGKIRILKNIDKNYFLLKDPKKFGAIKRLKKSELP